MRLRTFLSCIPPFDWLVAGLIVLYLVPLWAFQYLPTQDGPSHLNNAQILTDYANPVFQYTKIYDLRLEPFPNWLSHAGLAGLLRIFPPLTSEKILLSLYVIAFPLAFIAFLAAINPAKKPLGLLSFVFIYNYLFMMGFYNFVFSIPLLFATLAYFWKKRGRLTLLQAVVLNLLLLLTFFGHMITYLIALGSVAFIALITFISQRRSLRPALASLGISLLSLLPTVPLLVSYYLRSSFAGEIPTILLWRIQGLLKYFALQRILISFDHSGQDILGLTLSAILLLLFFLTLIKLIFQRHILTFDDNVLVLFFILFILFLLMPWEFGSGAWVNDRLALLANLFLIAWFDVSLPALPDRRAGLGWLKRAYSPALVVLCCAAAIFSLGVVTYTFAQLEPILQEYAVGMELIQPNTILLPLNFFTDEEKFSLTDPLVHANHYFTMTNGAVDLGNYEPFVDYFPVAFKPGLNLPIYFTGTPNWNDSLEQHQHTITLCKYTHMIDYLLVWGTPEYFFKIDIDQCYRLIFEKGRQKIYVPRR